MTDLRSLEMQIGKLTGSVEALIRELDRDRREAQEGRQRLYTRLEKGEDEASARFDRVEAEIKVVSSVASQARDVAAAVSKTVTDDVKPQTDKIKNLGLKGGGILTGVALVAGLGSGPAWAAVTNFFTNLTK